jgi:hypothetical protein
METCLCLYCGGPRLEKHDCVKTIEEAVEREIRKRKAELEAEMATKKQKLQDDVVRRQLEDLQRRTDIFEILNLPVSSTATQVKQAYMKKVKDLHPDKNGDLTQIQRKCYEDMLKEVNHKFSDYKVVTAALSEFICSTKPEITTPSNESMVEDLESLRKMLEIYKDGNIFTMLNLTPHSTTRELVQLAYKIQRGILQKLGQVKEYAASTTFLLRNLDNAYALFVQP